MDKSYKVIHFFCRPPVLELFEVNEKRVEQFNMFVCFLKIYTIYRIICSSGHPGSLPGYLLNWQILPLTNYISFKSEFNG